MGNRIELRVGDYYIGSYAYCEDAGLSLEDNLKISEQLINQWLNRTGRMSEMIETLEGKNK